MSECSDILIKVQHKTMELNETMRHIAHGYSMSSGPQIDIDDINDPMAMYDLIDAMQDLKDSIVIAKMFGCITGKPSPAYFPKNDRL